MFRSPKTPTPAEILIYFIGDGNNPEGDIHSDLREEARKNGVLHGTRTVWRARDDVLPRIADSSWHVPRFVARGGCDRYLDGRTWPLVGFARADPVDVGYVEVGDDFCLARGTDQGKSETVVYVGGKRAILETWRGHSGMEGCRLSRRSFFLATRPDDVEVRRVGRGWLAPAGGKHDYAALGYVERGLHAYVTARSVRVVVDQTGVPRLSELFVRLRAVVDEAHWLQITTTRDALAEVAGFVRSIGGILGDRAVEVRAVGSLPELVGHEDVGRPGTVTVVHLWPDDRSLLGRIARKEIVRGEDVDPLVSVADTRILHVLAFRPGRYRSGRHDRAVFRSLTGIWLPLGEPDAQGSSEMAVRRFVSRLVADRRFEVLSDLVWYLGACSASVAVVTDREARTLFVLEPGVGTSVFGKVSEHMRRAYASAVGTTSAGSRYRNGAGILHDGRTYRVWFSKSLPWYGSDARFVLPDERYETLVLDRDALMASCDPRLTLARRGGKPKVDVIADEGTCAALECLARAWVENDS